METLTICYTANLHGDEYSLVHTLPRLHTFIQKLKNEHGGRGAARCAPTNHCQIVLDLGNACAPDVWPCNVTGGRAALLVLDAMGYDAANVGGLTPENRAKLAQTAQMALVDQEHGWIHGDVQAILNQECRRGNLPGRPYLVVIMTPHSITHLEDNTLYLADVTGGQVGVAQIEYTATASRVIQQAVHNLPAHTAPDPTIAGTVDFVLDEARYYTHKRDST